MTHFILILYVSMALHGVSITTAEFNNKQSCENAGKEFLNMDKGWSTTGKYVCNEK